MASTAATSQDPLFEEDVTDIPAEVVGGLVRLFQSPSAIVSNAGLRILLGTLCGMASVAFAARDDPEDTGLGIGIGIDEYCKDGTHIKHLSRPSLEQCMDGALRIELKSATRFPFFGRSDPFVVFTNGVSMTKSQVVENNPNPTWDSTYYLLLRKNCILTEGASDLRIDMFDRDENFDDSVSYETLRANNSHIGSAVIPLTELKTSGVVNHEITLTTDRGNQGQTTLTFTTEFITLEQLQGALNRSDSTQWLEKSPLTDTSVSWTALSRRIGLEPVPLEPVVFFNSQSVGTQGWIYRNTDVKFIALSFRSTENDQREDILTDINVVPDYISSIASADYVIKPTDAFNVEGAFIHGGFSNAYTRCHDAILQTLYSLTNWDTEWTIGVTGHSLGAALAAVAAFEITNRRKVNGDSPHVGMFNFASPRVGNRDFCATYDRTIGASFRLLNRVDIVTAVPLTYFHVDRAVIVSENGEIDLERREVDFDGSPEEFETLERSQNDSEQLQTLLRRVRTSEILNYDSHSQQYHYQLVEAAVNRYFGQ
eukprot:g2711.t1